MHSNCSVRLGQQRGYVIDFHTLGGSIHFIDVSERGANIHFIDVSEGGAVLNDRVIAPLATTAGQHAKAACCASDQTSHS